MSLKRETEDNPTLYTESASPQSPAYLCIHMKKMNDSLVTLTSSI